MKAGTLDACRPSACLLVLVCSVSSPERGSRTIERQMAAEIQLGKGACTAKRLLSGSLCVGELQTEGLSAAGVVHMHRDRDASFDECTLESDDLLHANRTYHVSPKDLEGAAASATAESSSASAGEAAAEPAARGLHALRKGCGAH